MILMTLVHISNLGGFIMAGSDGFRTAPLGFDRNDVNNYISKLVQRLKTAEAEKNESNALASKAKEMKESYEARIAELEEAKKTYQASTEKEIKEYKLTIEELDIKVVALLSEMEQRRVASASGETDGNVKKQAEQIIKQAKFEANEIIENAKRERQNAINDTHFLLDTISAENRAIDSAFNSIKKSLEKCINSDIDAEFAQVTKSKAVTTTQTVDFVQPEVSQVDQSIPADSDNIQYARVDKAVAQEVEPVAEDIVVQAEEPVFSTSDLDDIFAVKEIENDSLSDEILDFTEVKKVETTTTSMDDDLSGLFAVPQEVSQSNASEFDISSNTQTNASFVEMEVEETPDTTPVVPTATSVEDDLSLFFSVEDSPAEEVVDTTVDFTQMDNGIDESAFDIKPLEPDANLFDSLWTIGSDDEDDEMSSDNVGIMDL